MIKTAYNKTKDTQQICFADGGGVVVPSGHGIKVDFNDIFPEEIDRLKNFFEFSDEPKAEPKRKRRTKQEE